MSVVELMQYLGGRWELTEGPFTFEVTADDVKLAYGNGRAHVTPVGGTGSAWVSVDRLRPVSVTV